MSLWTKDSTSFIQINMLNSYAFVPPSTPTHMYSLCHLTFHQALPLLGKFGRYNWLYIWNSIDRSSDTLVLCLYSWVLPLSNEELAGSKQRISRGEFEWSNSVLINTLPTMTPFQPYLLPVVSAGLLVLCYGPSMYAIFSCYPLELLCGVEKCWSNLIIEGSALVPYTSADFQWFHLSKLLKHFVIRVMFTLL